MSRILEEQVSWKVNGQPALLHPIRVTKDKALRHIIDSNEPINQQSQLMVLDGLARQWGNENPFGVLTIASWDGHHHLYGFRSTITFDILCICINISSGYYKRSTHVEQRMLMLNN